MILRTCVVIPAFDNSRTISEVIKDVITCTQFPVLVIDDGSETPVNNVLYSWETRNALESGRVRVLRLEKNCGKGGALQVAIKELVRDGFTHMVTMDADGQHFGHEIQKLVDLSLANPWDLVIGARQFKSPNVPEVSRFGRAFSNFWVSYQTGLHIKDSQSGFRLYPLLPVQNMRFLTTRYDFEIEVLIRLLWQGVHVREVDIEVFYPERNERVSHFNKFWDNLRISALNTLLVVVSLLRTHRSPSELSVALGLGVAIGCTPFFGFHTLIIAFVAFVLRLNLIVMWIGSHVSTPILAPFLIMSEIWIGKHWLNVGIDVAGKRGEFYQWLAGSGVLGLGLGLTTTIVSFILAWGMQRRKKRTNWSGRTRGGRFGNGLLKNVLRYLGIEAGYKCLLFIVPYFYIFAPTGRRGLSEYWKLMKPEDSWRERQGRIINHFYRFGQVLMDRVFQGFSKEKRFKVVSDGMQNIQTAIEKKQGVILLSAHTGAWDLAAALLGGHGFTDQVHTVEFVSDGYSFQKVKEKMNPSSLRMVDSGKRGEAIFEIHAALKKGSCLALMGDRPLADRFELIPFMGRLAPFDMTAFRVAAATRVPLLYTFAFKVGQEYRFFALPAKTYEFAREPAREIQCIEWAKDYARVIEGFLRQYPDQWFNFYPFWSALPSAPSGGLASLSNNYLVEDLQPPSPLRPALGSGPTSNDEA